MRLERKKKKDQQQRVSVKKLVREGQGGGGGREGRDQKRKGWVGTTDIRMGKRGKGTSVGRKVAKRVKPKKDCKEIQGLPVKKGYRGLKRGLGREALCGNVIEIPKGRKRKVVERKCGRKVRGRISTRFLCSQTSYRLLTNITEVGVLFWHQTCAVQQGSAKKREN